MALFERPWEDKKEDEEINIESEQPEQPESEEAKPKVVEKPSFHSDPGFDRNLMDEAMKLGGVLEFKEGEGDLPPPVDYKKKINKKP